LGLGFSFDDVMSEVCFAFSMTSSANPMSRFRSSKLCWKLGYNTSFWSLGRFSSVSGAKVMAKKSNFFIIS